MLEAYSWEKTSTAFGSQSLQIAPYDDKRTVSKIVVNSKWCQTLTLALLNSGTLNVVKPTLFTPNQDIEQTSILIMVAIVNRHSHLLQHYRHPIVGPIRHTLSFLISLLTFFSSLQTDELGGNQTVPYGLEWAPVSLFLVPIISLLAPILSVTWFNFSICSLWVAITCPAYNKTTLEYWHSDYSPQKDQDNSHM
jgi:hypothetical protein